MTGQGRGNRITTKDMEAIERIKGYRCRVEEHQWKDLIKACNNVEIGLWAYSTEVPQRWDVRRYAVSGKTEVILSFDKPTRDYIEIPFPDFIAKLKGDEKWEPKAGEMVEVGGGCVREYIAQRGGKHFCWGEKGDTVSSWLTVKPVRQTITRTEAESLLNKRIID
jgi:hypothetical protein